MVETRNENHNQNQHQGKEMNLTFEDQVVKKIAKYSTENIPSIVEFDKNAFGSLKERFTNNEDVTQGIDVNVNDNQAEVTFNAVVKYGVNIPQMFQELTRKASDTLRTTTGIKLVKLNLNVTDIKTEEELRSGKKSS